MNQTSKNAFAALSLVGACWLFSGAALAQESRAMDESGQTYLVDVSRTSWDAQGTKVEIDAQFHLGAKFWTLLGEPVVDCVGRWKVRQLKVTLPNYQVAYLDEKQVPANVWKELSVVAASFHFKTFEKTGSPTGYLFNCDAGIFGSPGDAGYSFNVPSSSSWSEFMYRDNGVIHGTIRDEDLSIKLREYLPVKRAQEQAMLGLNLERATAGLKSSNFLGETLSRPASPLGATASRVEFNVFPVLAWYENKLLNERREAEAKLREKARAKAKTRPAATDDPLAATLDDLGTQQTQMAETDRAAAVDRWRQLASRAEEVRNAHGAKRRSALCAEARLGISGSLDDALSQGQAAHAACSKGPKPGTVFRDCQDGTCPDMVWLPKGEFIMGNNDGDSNEKPVHTVSLNYFVAVGRTEVTFDQWDACVAAGVCRQFAVDEKTWGRGSRPVIGVTWNDVQQYVNWLSRKTGKPYRLLSEAEWEYAARAGSNTKYSWGDDPNHDQQCRHANGADQTGKRQFDDWFGAANCDDGFVYTAPVGSFAPNAFGLHDMFGNVYEWTQDCWNPSYNGAPNNGSAWESGDCAKRMLRGGSYFSLPYRFYAAYRSRHSTVDRNHSWGFRVARTVP